MFQSSLCCYYWYAELSKHMVRHQKHLPMFIGSKIIVHVVQVQNSRAQHTGIKPHGDPREFGAKSNTPSSMPTHAYLNRHRNHIHIPEYT